MRVDYEKKKVIQDSQETLDEINSMFLALNNQIT
jgi:hypothetical protein